MLLFLVILPQWAALHRCVRMTPGRPFSRRRQLAADGVWWFPSKGCCEPERETRDERWGFNYAKAAPINTRKAFLLYFFHSAAVCVLWQKTNQARLMHYSGRIYAPVCYSRTTSVTMCLGSESEPVCQECGHFIGNQIRHPDVSWRGNKSQRFIKEEAALLVNWQTLMESAGSIILRPSYFCCISIKQTHTHVHTYLWGCVCVIIWICDWNVDY